MITLNTTQARCWLISDDTTLIFHLSATRLPQMQSTHFSSAPVAKATTIQGDERHGEAKEEDNFSEKYRSIITARCCAVNGQREDAETEHG
jgi:hypothetical protein